MDGVQGVPEYGSKHLQLLPVLNPKKREAQQHWRAATRLLH
jgi:hypothetical protein